jgi:hypothetical protein
MKLKTIREQLLFAADFHYQNSKRCLENYNVLFPTNRRMAMQAKKLHSVHRKMADALDEALKLL